jgi:hypothetical protein
VNSFVTRIPYITISKRKIFYKFLSKFAVNFEFNIEISEINFFSVYIYVIFFLLPKNNGKIPKKRVNNNPRKSPIVGPVPPKKIVILSSSSIFEISPGGRFLFGL